MDKKPHNKITDFARTANTWHNQLVILKMQLQQLAAVIGSGLIQAIKPFVMQMNAALSGIIKFAQNVVNALGKIFGWKMEVNTKGLQLDEDALDYDADALENVADSADSVADSTNNAAKATKKLNAQLQGFDKLNVLRTTEKTPNTGTNKNKNGTGNNNTGDGTNAISGGEATAALKKTQGEFKSKIDNLFDLGKYIGDTLKKSLDKIKWDEVYESARNFGKGLAEFLNGLISPGLFASVGRTIAGALNTVLHFIDSFGETFDFGNFGKSLAYGINAFLHNIQWDTALSAAKNWGNGIADTLNKFVQYTNWKNIGESIAKAIKTAIMFWLKLGSGIKWKDIGQSLAKTINGAVEKFPAKDLANTIDAWVQGIYDLIITAISNIKWNKVKDKILELIENLDLKTIKILVSGLALVAGGAFAISISSAIITEVARQFIVMLASRLVALMPGSTLLSGAIGDGLGGSALVGISASTAMATAAFAGLAAGLAYVYATNEKVRDSFKKAVGTIKDALQPALDFLRTTVLPDLKSGFQKLVDILTPFGEFLRTVFTSAWMDFINPELERLGKDVLPPLVDAFKTFWTQILVPWANFLANTLSPQIKILSDILTWLWKNVVVPLGQFIGGQLLSYLQGLAEAFKLVVTVVGFVITVIGNVGVAFDKVKGIIGTAAGFIGQKIEDLKSYFVSFAESMGQKLEKAKSAFGSFKDSVVKNAGTIFTEGYNKIIDFRNGVVEKFSNIKSEAEKKFDDLRSSLPAKISDLASKFTSPFRAIATAFENGFKNAGIKAVNQVTKMYNDVINKMNDMIKGIKKVLPLALGKLFKFQLPTFEFQTKTLQLANLSITYPSGVRAKWNKRAYSDPLMFNVPTVLPTALGYQGFGDGAGGEMVYGHKNLMNDITEATGGSEMTAIGNRQLANDQRIISLLQIIAGKEFGVSSDALFRSVRDQASNYTARTGRQAFEF